MIIALSVALMMGSAVQAQDNKSEGKRPEKKFDKTEMVQRRTADVVKKYGLNDEQSKKLLALNTKYADKMGGPGRGDRGRHGGPGMRGARGDQKPSKDMKDGQRPSFPRDGKRPEMTEEQKQKMETFRKEREATMKAYDAELQQIMNAEQYKQYKADMQKRGERGKRQPKK